MGLMEADFGVVVLGTGGFAVVEELVLVEVLKL